MPTGSSTLSPRADRPLMGSRKGLRPAERRWGELRAENEALRRQINDLTAEREQLRAELARARNRNKAITRTLHDSIGPEVAGAGLLIHSMQSQSGRLATAMDEYRAVLQEAAAGVARLREGLRRLTREPGA